MIGRKFLAVGALVVASMGLSACMVNYAYGRAPGYDYGYGYGYDVGAAGWDRYYGDPFGWQRVPVGYLGSGFGWNNGFYYPGNGGFVYDQRGVRRAWNAQQRAYWQPRVAARRPVVVYPGRYPGRYPGQVRPGKVVRQQDRVIRQQDQALRQQRQVIREQRRDLQGGTGERRYARPEQRQARSEARAPQAAWQGGRGYGQRQSFEGRGQGRGDGRRGGGENRGRDQR
jgi:hypothetical protein